MKKTKQKKIKVLGVGKSPRHNYYIFPKKQQVFAIVRNLLRELGFNSEDWLYFGREKEPGCYEYLGEDNIKDYIDRRFAYENKECYIEIIFGKDKVFLMIHTEKDMQQKIAKILGKYILY